jgi:glycine/D-amino acid oxidase-like deaminating enzyme
MDPYWLVEDRSPIRSTPLGAPADVEIVGAGVTGCAAAHALARAGLRVRVYDERAVAAGASGRNGGFILRGTAAPFDVAAETVGEEVALRVWRWTEAEIEDLKRLADGTFRQVGSLRLAVDDEERDELQAEHDAMASAGIAVEWVDHPGGRLDGRFSAGLLHPPDGAIQPARWVRRLAHLAAEAGAEIVEHRRVESLDDLEAPTVLVATDGYLSGLLGELEGLIVPTRGQVIATEPLDERWFDVPHYGRHGFDYWHQDERGRIVAGGFRDVRLDEEFTSEEALTEPVQAALRRFVADLVGRELRVDYAWAGLFGLVFDFLPVVGRVPGSDRVWVAGGYSGHGNVLGFSCGRLAARAIQGEHDPLLDLFEPARLLNG